MGIFEAAMIFVLAMLALWAMERVRQDGGDR